MPGRDRVDERHRVAEQLMGHSLRCPADASIASCVGVHPGRSETRNEPEKVEHCERESGRKYAQPEQPSALAHGYPNSEAANGERDLFFRRAREQSDNAE